MLYFITLAFLTGSGLLNIAYVQRATMSAKVEVVVEGYLVE